MLENEYLSPIPKPLSTDFAAQNVKRKSCSHMVIRFHGTFFSTVNDAEARCNSDAAILTSTKDEPEWGHVVAMVAQ